MGGSLIEHMFCNIVTLTRVLILFFGCSQILIFDSYMSNVRRERTVNLLQYRAIVPRSV